MKTFIWLWLTITCIGSTSCRDRSAGVQEPNALSQDDKDVLFQIHNGDLAGAESKINAMLSNNADNLRGHFLKTSLYFHARYFASQGASRDSITTLLLKSCEEAITQAEKQSESIEQQFYLGSFYSFKSRALLAKREWTSAFFAARTGKNLLESVIESAPGYADAYLPLGVLYYFASTQQAWWQGALAWVVDLDVPKTQALKYIQKTYDEGLLNKNEAHFVLNNINLYFENKLDIAESLLQHYTSQFPNNRFFLAPMQGLKLTRITEEKGGEFLLAHLDSLVTAHPINGMQTLNRVGYQYLGQKKFPDALAVFQANVKLFPGSANSHDSLAECYYTMGQMQESKKYYSLALTKLSSDQTINEEFKKTLREGIEAKLKDLASY